MQNFDLLFFRGTDLTSNTISALEKRFVGSGDYTHVGILLNLEMLEKLKISPKPNESWYVWESVVSIPLAGLTDEISDIRTDRGGYGVQIRSLSEILQKYNGTIAVGSLKCEYYQIIDNISNKRLQKIYKKYGFRKYDANCLSLCGAMIPKLRPLRDALVKEEGYLFCSELVAEVFRSLKILPRTVNPRNYVPMDLVSLTRKIEVLNKIEL